MVYVTFVGVYIFSRRFISGTVTSGEAYYPTKLVTNGNHYAITITIIDITSLPGFQQPHLFHQFNGQAGNLGKFE